MILQCVFLPYAIELMTLALNRATRSCGIHTGVAIYFELARYFFAIGAASRQHRIYTAR
jgi:hypothetical protein